MPPARTRSAVAAVFATLFVTLGSIALVIVPATPLGGAAAQAASGCPTPAHSIVRSAPGAGKTVALTFDDGPSRFTPQILAILRKNNVRATFFETGAHGADHPDLVRQVAAEGHLVADHTYDHYYPTQVQGGWSSAYLGKQFDRTNSLQRHLTGRPTCFFRPPGGFQTSGMVQTARSRGMSTVMWSVDTEDWKQPAYSSEAATARIVTRAKAGGWQRHPIVLMHEGKASHEPESEVSSNRSNTVRALPAVIRYYREHGYRFVDLKGGSGLPPAPTELTTTTGRVEVLAGTSVTAVTGTLTDINGPVAGQSVRWYSRPAGNDKWTLRGTVDTGRQGKVSVVDRPKTSTQYRLAFAGSRRYAAASPVGMRTVATTLLPTTVTLSALDQVQAGEAVTITGSVSSNGTARPGVEVLVSRTVVGQADPVVTRTTTDAKGLFAFTDAPPGDAGYVVTVAKALPYASGSASVTVTVAAVPTPDQTQTTDPAAV